MVLVVGAALTAALPNGFVLLGRVWLGIKFSRLTSDEFSPRKLSGVLRVGLMPLPGGLPPFVVPPDNDDLRSKSETTGANGSLLADTPFVVESFHGLVDVGLFDTPPPPPKKSPNGSS